MTRLAARILTGTSLALLVALLVWLDGRFPPGRLVLVVVTVIALLGSREIDRMGSFRGRGLGFPLQVAALVLAVLLWRGRLFFEFDGAQARLLEIYVLTVLLTVPGHLVGHLLIRTDPGAPRRTPLAAVSFGAWLLPPLFALAVIDHVHGTMGLVVLIVLAKIGDNAAYFVGRKLGKRHPFPKISPGKTIAGCVASLVAGVVAGAVVLPFTLGERSLTGALLGGGVGALINLAAQAGDLSESWVKRRAGVKDSSGLLGPSGGVLDVIDSLLLAGPVALVLWSWVY